MKLLIFIGIVMFILGFYSGIAYTINRVVDVAVQFINVDKETVDAALFQYHSKLGNLNASLYVNPWNQELCG